jgi:hypothetical protein
MGIEDPDADVAEQQQAIDDDIDPVDDIEPVTDPNGIPLEADPADVAEQREVVPQDEDEAR